jgi:hypothetical protein
MQADVASGQMGSTPEREISDQRRFLERWYIQSRALATKQVAMQHRTITRLNKTIKAILGSHPKHIA